jgi:broad specificity phosphatase PhoE
LSGTVSVELVFETHSTSTDNERGIATGWLDGELSQTGRRQARELGLRRGKGVAAVYVSDLRRAVETAELAFAGSGIPVHEDARLRECNYGALNGGSVAEVTRERSGRIDEPFPGGESYRQVVERMRGFLVDVVLNHGAERVVAIGHSANRWALDHLVHGTPLEELVVAPFGWQPGWIYVVRANALSSSSDIE